jgi:CHAT domain-containing protein/tetratricopeptide (TPR) repeat protein
MNRHEGRLTDEHSSRTGQGVSMNRICGLCPKRPRSITSLIIEAVRIYLPVILMLSVLVFGANVRGLAATQKRKPAAKSRSSALLRLSKPIKAKLAAGETRAFRLTVKAGQYLHIAIEQQGIDLAATLIAPDGKPVSESDHAKGKQGSETLSLMAEAAGVYRVDISAPKNDAPPGRFTITLDELRAAKPNDSTRVAAEQLFLEGQRLQNQNSPDSRKQALDKFQAALARYRDAHDQKGEAVTLFEIGQTYRYLSDFQKAVELYNQALTPTRAVDDKKGEALILNSLGLAYDRLNQRDKSLPIYHQALTIRQAIGDRQGQAETLNNIGFIYRNRGEYQKALDYFNQSLPHIRAVDDRKTEIIILNNIGVTHRLSGAGDKALATHQEALRLARETTNREQEVVTLNNIAAVYESLDQIDKALDAYNQNLAIWRGLKNRRQEANTLNQIGEMYRKKVDGERALDYFNQALPIYQAEGDKNGEATIYNNMALVYRLWGELQKALDYYSRTLAIDRARGAPKAFEAQTLNNLGQAYFYLGDTQKALELYNQALPILQSVGDRRRVGYAFNNIGQTYLATDQVDKALEALNQAMVAWKETGDRAGEASTLSNLGEIYRKKNDRAKSLDYHQQAITISRSIGESKLESLSYLSIGKLYAESREWDKAMDFFAKTLELIKKTRDINTEIDVFYGLAYIERERGNLDQALVHIQSAIKKTETVRTQFLKKELRATYFSFVQKYYGFYIDLLMRLHRLRPGGGYVALALQASEGARARVLLELLTESQANIRQGLDPALLKRETSLRRELNAQTEREIQLLSSKGADADIDAIERNIESLKTKVQEIEQEIRAASPRYASLALPQPLSANEIQQQVVDADTALLEYWLGDERSFLWAVTPDGVTSYELPPRAEIDKLARRFYELVSDPRQKTSDASDRRGLRALQKGQQTENIASLAQSLGQILIGPVASQLGEKRLLIVPDGALHYVPFAALADPMKTRKSKHAEDDDLPGYKLKPLIVNHEIITLPSASTLAVLRREVKGRTPAPNMLAVVADPVFDEKDQRVQASRAIAKASAPKPTTVEATRGDRSLRVNLAQAATETGTEINGITLNRLPGTRREADRIIEFVSANERLEAFDFQANRETVTSNKLGTYRYIHIATHGFLNGAHPELSGIVLSTVDETGKAQDGFLLAHEFYTLKLPAELVVLSACQTGLGQEVRGEGLVGLTRGLMYAGAARIVVSLWDVNDNATAELMSAFYKKLFKKTEPPAASLRAAQIKLWEKKKWRAPYYWAAFVLQGEWR